MPRVSDRRPRTYENHARFNERRNAFPAADPPSVGILMGIDPNSIQNPKLRQKVLAALAREDRCPPSHPEPQPAFRHEPLAAAPGEESHPSRFRVCVVCYRQRLTDPDNLCPKYFIDCLRYAELIPDDTAAVIELAVRQEKVRLRSDERTELEVIPGPARPASGAE